MNYAAVVDGQMLGQLLQKPQRCGHCNAKTRVIRVDEVTTSFEPDERRMIAKKGARLGLGCGCYGRAHRQIAHIQDNMRS